MGWNDTQDKTNQQSTPPTRPSLPHRLQLALQARCAWGSGRQTITVPSGSPCRERWLHIHENDGHSGSMLWVKNHVRTKTGKRAVGATLVVAAIVLRAASSAAAAKVVQILLVVVVVVIIQIKTDALVFPWSSNSRCIPMIRIVMMLIKSMLYSQ